MKCDRAAWWYERASQDCLGGRDRPDSIGALSSQAATDGPRDICLARPGKQIVGTKGPERGRDVNCDVTAYHSINEARRVLR